jgi:hypothetical protein
MKKTIWLFILFGIGGLALTGQSITVTSPTAGAYWCLGSTHTITWTKSGTMPANVAVRLRRAGAPETELAVVNITDSTANDGSLSWIIPASVPVGDYFIRVRTSSPDVIGDSGTFSIAPALPSSLTVTTPNGGEKWAVHSPQVIKWNAVNVAGKVRLELVKEQGPMLGVIFDNLDPYSGSHSWAAGKYGINQTAPPGDYLVRVRSLSNFQLSDQSDQPFTLKFLMTAPHLPVALAKPDLVACTETAVYVPLKTLGWFHVHVRNIGKGTAKAPFDVEIFLAGHSPIRSTINKDLAPGETRWVRSIADSSLGEATIGFMVNADPDNKVMESNEENNRANGLLLIEEGNPTYNTPIRCGDGSTI